MFRDTAVDAGQTIDDLVDDIQRTEDEQSQRRSAWVLSAVDAYKASCLAAGEAPTQEDVWLVVLSALQLEDAR